MKRCLALIPMCCALAGPALANCAAAPDPVISLDYGSRYQDGDSSRSTLDEDSNAAVNDALRPVDDFIRDLASASDDVLRGGAKAQETADCVIAQIADWARADALSDLGSFTARLSVGARISGIAEAYRQVRPFASDLSAATTIEDWLHARATEQLAFWEKEATTGARVGNLRGWAALALLNVGEVTGDDALVAWASASAVRILCTARADGSLPQETKRGAYGLHYQFHALSPLTTIAARLDGVGRPITGLCGDALQRVVAYAFADYDAGGALTKGYSGKDQSYFDGTESLEPHELAFLPAYLRLFPGSPLVTRANALETLSNSKLGGNQRLLWDPES
ncbi:alginate lyase family protein [Tropicibacter naphthalenivorans]|uniref:Alginate lyase n=1 Tax=Tropicibacter naphthalenivorans TaxID=441103 RepID=A0A0N7M0C5_9RHOB|nr:alginate lyase family protein [Tropicibacter naphthalenivorans]CUH80081.1 Alginate lyase precursor [Tropicibacter naphthalenivorans]SMC84445.1 poly(beta-D-mannuronate) lyase [Tropicibacter naphthalenivorans]